jgi:hypothetical protein
VQPDRRLARARPALDHERARPPVRDQVVLLRRDRRDDLAHLADALARDVVDDRLREVVGLAGADPLVDEAEHRAVLDVQAPPALHAARVLRRGGVERLGRRRPPVDRQQPVVAAGDGVPADVQRSLPLPVDPPEVQRPARRRVRAQALEPHPLEHLLRELVPLAPAPARRQRAQDRLVGGVGLLEVGLLGGEVGVGHGQSRSLPRAGCRPLPAPSDA